MRKGLIVGLVLLLATTVAVFSEIGTGITVTYPIGAAIMYSDIYGSRFDPQPIFFGPTVRWKYSVLYLDAAARYWPHAAMLHGNLNIGICGDFAFLRFGLSGGIDGIVMPLAGSGTISKSGWNVKLDIDVFIKQVSAGVSVAFPTDVLQKMQTYGYALVGPFDELRSYAGQVSVNVIYWFGQSRRTRYRGGVR